jgi:6-phosphogluconolactonase
VKPQVKLASDAVTLYHLAADSFRAAALEAVRGKGSFAVALSGGSTPRSVYSILAKEPAFRDEIPWDKCFFFWGDERHVPPESADSNFRMATETMLSKLPIASSQIFRINGEMPDASNAALEYESKLSVFFKLGSGEFPRFDFVLLGMGPDGHTASLFPGTDALNEERRSVVANWVGKFGASRITMTAPVFNNSANVMFLVSGEDKAPAFRSVHEGPYSPQELPAQLIRPHNGSLVWLVDAAAGKLLQNCQLQEA